MSLKWLEPAEPRFFESQCGTFKLKVYETMLGQSTYLVVRNDRIEKAGSVQSVEVAQARAEVLARAYSQS